MFICLCNAVTDKQIIEAVENGAADINMLAITLKVATKCGKCKPFAEELIQTTLCSQPCKTKSNAPCAAYVTGCERSL